MLCIFWHLIYKDGESRLSFAIVLLWLNQSQIRRCQETTTAQGGRNVLTKKTKMKLKEESATELKVG